MQGTGCRYERDAEPGKVGKRWGHDVSHLLKTDSALKWLTQNHVRKYEGGYPQLFMAGIVPSSPSSTQVLIVAHVGFSSGTLLLTPNSSFSKTPLLLKERQGTND